ncbi:hypothetical protein [Solwaraspora sp. WMMA2065]|uniref:hypothetical protein n=1 Tax=Solwaraspora sp. WMMA2065 TaxID=3015166 RepID=UPI00259BF38F|nr:hypothetical protein [Solwaraspora sp. WMMA2065]WJK32282.1 hypothetical protein O7610_15995 [Solwaraspora sp. WMMA2065]
MTGRRTSVGALALVLIAGAGGLPSAPAVAAPPQVSVDAASAAVGEWLTVTLTGWPAGNVQLEICGNRAARGSVDCAASEASQLHVPGADAVTSRLVLVEPPVACPCVVRARTVDAGGSGTGPVLPVTGSVPIDIVGSAAPLAPTVSGPARLHITDVTVVPTGWDWPALFGLSSEIRLDVDVRNDGPVDADELRLSLLSGRPGRPTVIVEPPGPASAPLATGAGRAIVVTAPVDFPVYGRYAVHGQLGTGVGGDGAVAFVVETERYPWGWPAVAAVLVVVLLLRQVIGLRRISRSPSGTER